MSNKKRISKKINKLENKQLNIFAYKIEIAGKNAEKAGSIFLKLVEVIDNNTKKLKAILDQRTGFDYQSSNNPNHRMFIDDVRKLTPLNYIQVSNLCREIPEKLYEDYKSLLIVGFPADEALELLKETYKF